VVEPLTLPPVPPIVIPPPVGLPVPPLVTVAVADPLMLAEELFAD
jgi:hypothetical protein